MARPTGYVGTVEDSTPELVAARCESCGWRGPARPSTRPGRAGARSDLDAHRDTAHPRLVAAAARMARYRARAADARRRVDL